MVEMYKMFTYQVAIVGRGEADGDSTPVKVFEDPGHGQKGQVMTSQDVIQPVALLPAWKKDFLLH